MFWLLVIGLVHAYFIWDGDILVPYALCGILLLWWMRRFSAPVLLGASCVVLFIGAVLESETSSPGTDQRGRPHAGDGELMPTDAQTKEQLDSLLGSHAEVVRHRAPIVFLVQSFVFATSSSGAAAG